ncbi:MAG: hypothetical protein PHE53_11065 [Thermoguttaceae bacterium]|nr:hypothetical protein [Thermoguttaceae bacterium]
MDGRILLESVDIRMPGGDIDWVHKRSYDNLADIGLDELNGNHWDVVSLPLVLTLSPSDPEIIQVSLGFREVLTFDRATSGNQVTYTGRDQVTDQLLFNAADQTYTLLRNNGQTWSFQGFFPLINTTHPAGSLISVTSPSGSALATEYDDSGALVRVHKTYTENGVAHHEFLAYQFSESGKITALTLLRGVSASVSEATPIQRVLYTYYDDSGIHGSVGDLRSVTTQRKDETAETETWLDTGTTYFRYYTDDSIQSCMKYLCTPNDYARLCTAQNITDPDSVEDSVVAGYASKYFEFETNRQAVKEVLDGGVRHFEVEFTTYGDSTDANTVCQKSEEIRPDGSRCVVYSNRYGSVILRDSIPATSANSTETRMMEFNTFTNSGLIARQYTSESIHLYSPPTTITGPFVFAIHTNGDTLTDEEQANAYILIRQNEGRIDANIYGTADHLLNHVIRRQIQIGASGNPITIEETDYTAHMRTGKSVEVLPAAVRRFPETTGSGITSATYSYIFDSATDLMVQRTTSLPAVSAAENGDGAAVSTVERFDRKGRRIWYKDELGMISYSAYNDQKGVMIRNIVDVDTTKTGDFSTVVPSGWSTISGGGKHLITDYDHDESGRVIRTLGPKNMTVSSDNTVQATRPAHWTVYDDVYRETRGASGYVVLNSDGNIASSVLVNPVSITKYDWEGNTVEQITASRVSTSGELLITDTFDQTSYISWQKTIYTDRLISATRQYFLIPAVGDGTKDVHYHETLYGYDTQLRRIRTTSPDGTIRKVVYDWRNNVIESWIGTTDTNLMKESDAIYGGPSTCATCAGTQDKLRVRTRYVDESSTTARVTEYEYDSRGRQIHIHHESDADGNATYTKTTYDNLDRPTLVERYLWNESGVDRLLSHVQQYYNGRGQFGKRFIRSWIHRQVRSMARWKVSPGMTQRDAVSRLSPLVKTRVVIRYTTRLAEWSGRIRRWRQRTEM